MKKPLLLLLCVALATVSFAYPPARKGHSRHTNPLDFPVAGSHSTIRDQWGARRAGGTRKHKGVDIHAHKGTPVVAVCDGVIVNRDHTPIGGNTLWLKSPHNTWTAYYAHLDRQLVREGQHVRKGQVIGTVGNSGNARTTPSHLHFGVKQGGHWVNPLPYVKGAAKVAAKSPQKKTVAHSRKTRRA